MLLMWNGWTCSWGKSSFILKCYLKFSYSHAWNTVVMSVLVFVVASMLELLEKLQKQICRTFGPSIAASLEPLAPYWNVANLSLFYRYYFGTCSTCCRNRLHNFSVSILDVIRMSMSTVSFLAQLDTGILCLWNSFLWPMI